MTEEPKTTKIKVSLTKGPLYLERFTGRPKGEAPGTKAVN